MSLRYVAMDAAPDAFWTFDDPSPFTDYSGNGRSSSSGATAKHAALVKGVDYSLIFGNATRVSFNAYAVMQRGREKQSFSVGAVFRSIKKDPTNLSIQQVWGNDNGYDGICIAGTVVSFSTKYTTSGEAKCTFDIQDNANVRVFGVHTAVKNSLYVNGDLVSEVDLTPAQQADTYLYDGNTITGGATAGTNVLAIGSIGVYRHVVPEDDIDAQLAEAIDNMSEFHVASGYGASILGVTEDHTSPYHNRTFSSEADWKQGGQSYGTIVEYEQLAPELRNGISIPSSWITAYPLPQGVGTMYGVIITWLGQGVTVDASLDGTTWVPVTKGVKISNIPAGFDPTDKMLQVRASFVGSVVDDPAHIDDLSITTYLANTVPALDGRIVTLTNTSIEHNEDIMDYDHNWGAELVNGTINIAAVGTGSFAPKTIEIWAKKAGAAAFTDNVSATASYTNGTTLQAYQVDEWQLRTYVINAGMTGALTFTGTGQIGTVLLYPYAKTAAEVMEAYRAFVGRPTLTLPVQGSIGIVELTAQIDAYEYDWSMESVG